MTEPTSLKDWPVNEQPSQKTVINYLEELSKKAEKVKETKHDLNGRKFYEAQVPTIAGPSTLYRWADQQQWTYRLPGEGEKLVIRSPMEIAVSCDSLGNAPISEEWKLLDDVEASGELAKLKDEINHTRQNPYFYQDVLLASLKNLRGLRSQMERNKKIQEDQAQALKERQEAAEKKYGKGLAVCSAHLTQALRENKYHRGTITVLNPLSGTPDGVTCKYCGGTVPASIILSDMKELKQQ